ncbi:MAG TPA: hypothetical protein VFX41_04215 [Actinomycetales bacterium]|nr:hypothetical protein [Actinomycetales bacterium]
MSPAPAGEHPSPEELDALLDDPAGSPDAAEHVETCRDCQQVLAGMRQVRQALREEGARPVDMPAEVEARLQGALARVSAERSGTIVPLHPGGRPAGDGDRVKASRVPRWLTVAAGLIVLGGAATATTQLLGGSGAGDSTTAGRAESSGGAGAPSLSLRPLATGTDYEPDKLGGQVDTLLASGLVTSGSAPALPQPESRDFAAAEDGPLADPAGLHGCLTALGAGDQPPLAVDLASWEGKDAAVIVLGDPSATDSVQVWVVGRGCAPGDDQLMHYQRVPRR